MSKRAGNKFYISGEPDGRCEYCGKIDELRPYGENGARICYECGMKNRAKTEEMFAKITSGVKLFIVGDSKDFS